MDCARAADSGCRDANTWQMEKQNRAERLGAALPHLHSVLWSSIGAWRSIEKVVIWWHLNAHRQNHNALYTQCYLVITSETLVRYMNTLHLAFLSGNRTFWHLVFTEFTHLSTVAQIYLMRQMNQFGGISPIIEQSLAVYAHGTAPALILHLQGVAYASKQSVMITWDSSFSTA